MGKFYNKESRSACACSHAQAEKRNRKNVSEKYNSSTNIFFRYREPTLEKKEKENNGIKGIQFLPTDFQKDKIGIIFRKR